jgi:hypothetical protein
LPGRYSVIQVLDGVSQLWSNLSGTAPGSPLQVTSDGVNYRVYNPTGVPIGGVITAGGSGFTSVPTVTASTGGSTWGAILGGNVASVSIATGAGGSGYTIPPLVTFSAPPAPGFAATGYATLTAGAVSAVTLLNNGAGYISAPSVTFTPDPNDTSAGITSAVATTTLGTAGVVSAVYPINQGTTLTAVPTLTISGGGGTGATANPVCAFGITGVTIGTAGATVIGTVAQILSVGGMDTSTPAANLANPYFGAGRLNVRPANIYAPVSGGALGTPVIVDAGLFETAPVPVIVQQSGAAPGTAPAATFAIGAVRDAVYITPC